MGLRDHGTLFGELGRQLGIAAGLHHTDARALVEILGAQDNGAPLTQSELSHRIGLTTGATSSLLNRLEAAGHIERVRNHADRRVVTLHATEGVDAMVDRFFDPLIDRMGAMMDGYPPELLDEFARFLGDVSRTMKGYLEELPAR
ncbi:MarR family transcriptional regulator [Paractinoplanes durhamensis]|uniref:MarR family transcriptional regulator n=2 Tax=Paractinoplanes durhamensis TaxID=113563 RepID=A0ABQ3YWL4_9ACTN|nr:MarR family transcriptional regulator [Actinoplanes durhamensis]